MCGAGLLFSFSMRLNAGPASAVTVAIAFMNDAALFARSLHIPAFVIRLTAAKTVAIDGAVQFVFLLPDIAVARLFTATAIGSCSPSAPKHHQGAQYNR
jgi:hypothetical protein